MAKKRHIPDIDEQAQAVLYAAVHGDEAAAARFGLSPRSLQRYRALAREPGSELSQVVAAYAAALTGSESASPVRVERFAAWVAEATRSTHTLFLDRAGQATARSADNPEALRALSEHMGRLLDHGAALAYIERALPATTDPDDDAARAGQADHGARPPDAPTFHARPGAVA